MEEVREKGHSRIGMGYIPFFTDYSVYAGIKLIAGQQKQRFSSLMLNIVKEHYASLMGQELNIIEPKEFHRQIAEASKKKGTSNVSDYIEYCCSKYLEKAVERMKPQIKRG